MKYVTKKLTEDTEPLVYRFQAKYVLKTGEKLTEAKAIKKGMEYALAHIDEKKTKKYSLKDLKGIIKGGPKTNATEEIDHVVYGI